MVKKLSWLVASEWIVISYMILCGTAVGNMLFYVYINIVQEAGKEFKI